VKQFMRVCLRTLTAVSLILFVTILFVWITDGATTTSRELILLPPGGHACALIHFDGHLYAAMFALHMSSNAWHGGFNTDHEWSLGIYCLSVLADNHGIWRHLGGFGSTSFDGRPPYEMFRGASVVMIPTWLPLLILGILPSCTLRRIVARRQRRRAGLCRQCGYDLRATPDRCPECGAVPLAFSGKERGAANDIDRNANRPA
jgi:hypothetical protein